MTRVLTPYFTSSHCDEKKAIICKPKKQSALWDLIPDEGKFNPLCFSFLIISVFSALVTQRVEGSYGQHDALFQSETPVLLWQLVAVGQMPKLNAEFCSKQLSLWSL